MARKKTKKQPYLFPLTVVSINAVVLAAIAVAVGFLFLQSKTSVKPAHSDQTSQVDEYQEETASSSPVLGSQSSDKVILHGDRNKKQIAITFDAEMTYGMKDALISHKVASSYDSRIIDTLTKTQTKATLFLTGMWVQLYPDVAKKLAQNPLFEIGSHSYIDSSYAGSCYGLKPTADSEDLEEIETTQKILRDTLGVQNKLFRFPGGCYDDYDIKAVSDIAGLKIVHWDVVGGDGFNDNAASIVTAVVSHVQNGSIIVLHMNGAPTAPKTADALPEIIKELKAKGFTFVKVSELLGY